MTATRSHPSTSAARLSLRFTSVSSFSLIARLFCRPDQGAHESHHLGLLHTKCSENRCDAVRKCHGFALRSRGTQNSGAQSRHWDWGCTTRSPVVRESHTASPASPVGQCTLGKPGFSKGAASDDVTATRRVLTDPPAAHTDVSGTQGLQTEVRAWVAGIARSPG